MIVSQLLFAYFYHFQSMVPIQYIKLKYKFVSYVPFLPNRRGWGSLWIPELLGAFLVVEPVKPGGLELQPGVKLLGAGAGNCRWHRDTGGRGLLLVASGSWGRSQHCAREAQRPGAAAS